jgi:hypothetical protein
MAGGRLRSDEEEQKRKDSGEKGRDLTGSGWERDEDQVKMSRTLEKIGKEVGGGVTAGEISSGSLIFSCLDHFLVAIAYVMQKTPYVFPIVGGRKVEHLKQNIEALTISLTPEHIAEIEGVLPFDPGFPHTFVVRFSVPSF